MINNSIPNLSNYKKTCKRFSWKTAEKELDWFDNRKLNIAYNAVDRHAKTKRANKIALYWQGANGEEKKYTFKELSILSNKFANVLKDLGIKKKDRVFIFLSRTPELYISLLGILKTGAIAGTLFASFGTQGLLERLKNACTKVRH